MNQLPLRYDRFVSFDIKFTRLGFQNAFFATCLVNLLVVLFKKKNVRVGPPLAKLFGSAHGTHRLISASILHILPQKPGFLAASPKCKRAFSDERCLSNYVVRVHHDLREKPFVHFIYNKAANQVTYFKYMTHTQLRTIFYEHRL